MSKTIEEIKSEVAKEYTSGKSVWYGNYLSERIKLVLMNEVAQRYAQSQTQELQEQNAELLRTLHSVANLLDVDAKISVDSIKRILTKHNNLK